MHGRIIMSHDYIDLLSYGIHKSPQFSISFPAKKIAPLASDSNDEPQISPPSIEDLVIPDELMDQISELKGWLKYNGELMEKFGMKYKLKKGYRTLFYGPPGTGKTFTAQILGNELNKEVYKIDLSMIVSKYIGETEKNLELLFARAEDKDWILFFDEADALFGKRTNVRDAHDKYANQEVSYLLQRIEDYNGLVILATNMKNNIDEAFIRRFNSLLKFPFPDAGQRAQIWKKSLPKNAVFRRKIQIGDLTTEEVVDIPEVVKKYELTGGNIINVVHYAGIKAVENLHHTVLHENGNGLSSHSKQNSSNYNTDEPLTIYLSDVVDGIKRELIKEGKPFSG
jgi:SpoVK/Ycf46/Vps4 family AAA+-type ATPase